jgi:ABC-type transporter Mla subunit MlaD
VRRALAIGAVIAAAAGAAVLTGASGGETGARYRILFDNAFGIVEGADFKVAGVRAGQVETFDLSAGYPPRAVVEVVVEEPGLRALRADARCEIKPQSLIGEYFVDCDPGRSDQPLKEDTVQVDRSAGTIPLDLVNNIMREPQRERLPLILNALGAGLAGRPDDVREVLERAHPGLRETNETLRILGRQEDIIERFVADADEVVGALEERKRDVVDFIDEAEDTARVSAGRREDLARTFNRLPRFLAELEPTMARLEDVADAQVPVLRNLREAAPGLDRTLRELEPFAAASEPALRTLGNLSTTGSATIRETRDEIRELRDLAAEAPELGDPLRKLLQALDDRARSIEPDPRSVETAPPAPDKTADTEGKGFTGFESLLNYFYWQTLAINQFDEVSHVLRANPIIDECSPYSVNPIREGREHCQAWLGPTQPGINAPDPTVGGAQAAAERRDGPPEPDGERQAAADQAPTAAAPGRGEASPDPSQPRFVLPDGVQQLVDRLTDLTERAPAPRGGGSEQQPLLDFLLGP